MNIELINESASHCDGDALESVAEYALARMGIHPESELSITLVDEDHMSELHVKWMDLPGPTDVLSFPMDEMKPHSAASGPGVVGDIVLCPDFAKAQAKEHQHSLDDELALLTVHGVLHLLGYDHAELDEEKVMFELQDKLLNEWKSKR